jgi:hypothetical protein
MSVGTSKDVGGGSHVRSLVPAKTFFIYRGVDEDIRQLENLLRHVL